MEQPRQRHCGGFMTSQENSYYLILYLLITHRFPGFFVPGLKTYLAAMKKYQPKYVYDEVAFQGWQSASLLATGLKGAGKNPTQLSLINAVNSLSAFNAGGMTTPVNWTSSGSGHNPPITYPTCSAYIQAKGTQFYSVFTKSPKVFLCFNQNSKNPVTAPAGTPGG